MSSDMNFDNLEDFHLDAFQEVSNIGAGHSATALSQLLSRRVDMSVPTVTLEKVERFQETLGLRLGELDRVAIVGSQTRGDIVYELVALLAGDSTSGLLEIVRGTDQPIASHPSELSSLDASIINEVGNILLLHYVAGVNTFLSLALFPAAPKFHSETGVEGFIKLKKEAGITHMLVVDVEIFTHPNITAVLLLLPTSDTIDSFLTAIFG